MTPHGDPELLLRAGRRCALLSAELGSMETTLAGADGRMHWSGAAAGAFSARCATHRRAVADARAVVERLGVLSVEFGHELAQLQQRARSLDATTSAHSEVEERIRLLRARFRRHLRSVESALNHVRLRLGAPPGRWTGPVRLPVGAVEHKPLHPGRWTGPVQLPVTVGPGHVPLRDPGRWTGPVRPRDWDRDRVPLPARSSAPPAVTGLQRGGSS